jgi:hypothetical protein
LKWGNVFSPNPGNVFSPNPGKAMKKAKEILETYELFICGEKNSELILQ